MKILTKLLENVLGAVVHGFGIQLYRHLDKFPRGANVTIEVLHRMILTVWEKNGGRLPKKLYIQMDNCWRENKNKFVFAFLSDLVLKVIFSSLYMFEMSIELLGSF